MKLFRKYLRPQLLLIMLALSLKFFGAVTDLLLPRILAFLIDDIAPTGSISSIFKYGFLMIAIAGLSLLLNINGNRKAAQVASTVTKKVRLDLFSKISTLSLHQIDEKTIGSLETRITSDTYNIQAIIGQFLRMGIRAPITLLGGILLSLTLDAKLTLIILAVLPFISLIVYIISTKGVPLYTNVQEKSDEMVTKIRESVTGIRVIKALSTSEYEKEKFTTSNEALTKADIKATKLMAKSSPLINFLLNIGTVFVIYFGALRVNKGLCEPGAILAFITYFTVISNAMISITRIFIRSTKAAASANRIQDIFDMPVDLLNIPAESNKINSNERVNCLEFNHVNFSYLGKKNQLTDITFSLKYGQTLGIIGATGSGKTTLLLLLMRFYDVSSGQILIHGQNIKEIPSEKLHTMFGIAFQNDYLFSDSIYKNISFGRNLSKQQVINAASAAQAEPFIQKYPDGFFHELTIKGSNLSGGQKQRLLISRALAGNPEFLILDDSSSALDYKTDAKIRQKLAERKNASATIIVAQRISSISKADLILVLDDGCIKGIGTHEELLASCKIYQEISHVQMGTKNKKEQSHEK